MDWVLDKKRPICPQICERLCVEIAAGTLTPHERLCSVRELAVRLGVNPNTVQKSFEQLEAQGLIYSVRGSGWFVCEQKDAAEAIVQQVIRDRVCSFFDEMQTLGLNEEEIKTYVKEWGKDE